MYSGRQKTLSLLPTQMIALAFGIGLFVLLLFLAGQSAFKRAQESAPGFTHNLTHGADREMNDGTRAGRGLAARPNGSPGPSTGSYMVPSATYRTPPIGVLPPGGAGGQMVFLGEGEKEAAKESLVPLHELMESVRRFDSTVWNGANVVSDTAPKQNPSLLLDALDSDAALVSHPLRFPEPLQDDAMETTRELRTYLATVRCAGVGSQTGTPNDDQPVLLAAAHRHLERGARLLAHLDAAANGGGTAAATSGYVGLP